MFTWTKKDGKSVIKLVNYSAYSETSLDFLDHRITFHNEFSSNKLPFELNSQIFSLSILFLSTFAPFNKV